MKDVCRRQKYLKSNDKDGRNIRLECQALQSLKHSRNQTLRLKLFFAVVLIVDDDENQRWIVKTYLEKFGFDVKAAENGVAMREQLAEHKVDLVLLDVSMPGEDGFALARYLREHHELGIIMLTAAAELFDRVLGLEIGADDYITKPFEPRELMARVKAVLRRISEQGESTRNIQPGKNPAHVAFGKFMLCMESGELRDTDGELVLLTSMEFDLLKAFAENPGRVLPRESLLKIAQGNRIPVCR